MQRAAPPYNPALFLRSDTAIITLCLKAGKTILKNTLPFFEIELLVEGYPTTYLYLCR